MKAATKNKVKTAVSKVSKTTTEAAKKAGEYATSNPKTVLYVVVGGIAIYSIYKLIEAAKKTGDILSGDNVENNIEIGNALVVNPTNTTITSNQATIYANQLLEAMNWKGFIFPVGYQHGTDNDTIEAIFDKINAEDFKMIYQKFGKKHYNGFGSPDSNAIGGIESAIGIADLKDLVYWLNAELSSIFDRTLYKKVKTIVEQAGFIFA